MTVQPSGIYVASRVQHADMWRQLRSVLHLPINSTWIDEAGEDETKDFSELWTRIGAEIRQSACLLFYVRDMDDFPFKGALIEVGMALAYNKPVFVCLEDVTLEGRTLRPVGSWMLHPAVRSFGSLADTLGAIRKFIGR